MIKKIIAIISLFLVVFVISFIAIAIIRTYRTVAPEPQHYSEVFTFSTPQTQTLNRVLNRLDLRVSNIILGRNSLNPKTDVLILISDNYSLPSDYETKVNDWLTEDKLLILLRNEGFFYESETIEVEIDNWPNVSTIQYGIIDEERIYQHKDYKTLIAAENRTLLLKSENGNLIVDSTIFYNENILEADNIHLLNYLTEEFQGGRVQIIAAKETIERPRREPGFFFKGMFLLVWVQLLIFALFYVRTYRPRFGIAIDPDKYRRRSIIPHLEAIGNYYQKVRAVDLSDDILDNHFYRKLEKHFPLTKNRNEIVLELTKRYNLTQKEIEAISERPSIPRTEVEDIRNRILKKAKIN